MRKRAKNNGEPVNIADWINAYHLARGARPEQQGLDEDEAALLRSIFRAAFLDGRLDKGADPEVTTWALA